MRRKNKQLGPGPALPASINAEKLALLGITEDDFRQSIQRQSKSNSVILGKLIDLAIGKQGEIAETIIVCPIDYKTAKSIQSDPNKQTDIIDKLIPNEVDTATSVLKDSVSTENPEGGGTPKKIPADAGVGSDPKNLPENRACETPSQPDAKRMALESLG